MDDVADALRSGIIAAQSGNRDEARAWFVHVVKHEPRNEAAWLWLSSVMPTTEQAIKCLDHLLTINPANQQAREAEEIMQVRMLLEEASFVQQQQSGQATGASPKASLRLGDLLISQNVLTPAQLDNALREQQRLTRLGRPSRLGEVLLSSKLIRREQLAAALRAQIDGVKRTSEPNLVMSLGQYLVRQNHITGDQLARALASLAEQKRRGRDVKLGEVLVRSGYITQGQLERALLEQRREYELNFR